MVPFSSWIARSASTRWSNLMNPTPFDRPAKVTHRAARNENYIEERGGISEARFFLTLLLIMPKFKKDVNGWFLFIYFIYFLYIYIIYIYIHIFFVNWGNKWKLPRLERLSRISSYKFKRPYTDLKKWPFPWRQFLQINCIFKHEVSNVLTKWYENWSFFNTIASQWKKWAAARESWVRQLSDLKET